MSARLPWTALLFAGLVAASAACGEVTTSFIDGGTDGTPTCSPACDVNATCTGTTCACDDGYSGDGQTCTDVDECATANGGCDLHALCTNTAGSRSCACVLGYVGDGLTCQPVWSNVASFPGVVIDPDRFGAMAIGVGTRVYFANETNTPANELFRYFETTTNTLSPQLALPPGTQSDFCACGYTQVFVSDGASIFMLGNYGQRFNVANGTWASFDSYVMTAQRGEAAGVFDPSSGMLMLAGGRGPLNNAMTLNVGVGTWGNEPGVMPFAVDSAKAWALPGSSTVYVAGGYSSDNNSRHLIKHQIGALAWEVLPDAPQDIGRPLGIGHFGNRLWVANDSVLMFFNPATSTWDRTVGAPANTKAVAFAAGTAWALVQGTNGLEVHKLLTIQ